MGVYPFITFLFLEVDNHSICILRDIRTESFYKYLFPISLMIKNLLKLKAVEVNVVYCYLSIITFFLLLSPEILLLLVT